MINDIFTANSLQTIQITIMQQLEVLSSYLIKLNTQNRYNLTKKEINKIINTCSNSLQN
jgi:hypothetical protein